MASSKPAENTDALNDGIENPGASEVEIPGLGVPPANPPAEEPRKRGRPKGSTKNNAPVDKPEIEKILDEQNGTVPESEKPQAKKRGPKGGTKASVEAMANQLVGVHQLVSMVTGISEIQITPDEGAALAGAIQSVCDEYGLSISGKTGAALQLLAAAAMIYGPRAVVIHQKVKAAQARDITPANH